MCEHLYLFEGNHRSFWRWRVWVLGGIPDSFVDDMSSVINESFSSGVFATDFHELLEGRVISIVVEPILLEIWRHIWRHHKADWFRHLTNIITQLKHQSSIIIRISKIHQDITQMHCIFINNWSSEINSSNITKSMMPSLHCFNWFLVKSCPVSKGLSIDLTYILNALPFLVVVLWKSPLFILKSFRPWICINTTLLNFQGLFWISFRPYFYSNCFFWVSKFSTRPP